MRSVGPDENGQGPSYLELAIENSLEEIVEECAGLADASADLVAVEECLALNSLLWILEDMESRYFPGVSEQSLRRTE